MTRTITSREDWSVGLLRSSKVKVPPGCKTKAWFELYEDIGVSWTIITAPLVSKVWDASLY
jgi:hypothetical protein